MSPHTRSAEIPGAVTSTGGDLFRARLRDLNWIRDAGPVELRAAVHALCWRASRSTIEGFCTDAEVCEKVLITARGVAAELESRTVTVNASIGDRPAAVELAELQRERTSLRRRLATAASTIAACDAAVQLARLASGRRGERTAAELAAAIAEHRRRVHPDEACQADADLWGVLDSAGNDERLVAARTA